MSRVPARKETYISGGVIDNVNGTVTSSKIDFFEYEKDGAKTGAKGVGLILAIKTDDGVEAVQFYSAGSPDVYYPSKDGKFLESDVKEGLNRNSNLAIFNVEAENAGFPLTKLESDQGYGAYVGVYAHFIAKAGPKREGLEGAKDKSIVVFSKVHRLPGEKAAKAATAAAKPTDGQSSDVEAELAGLVVSVLAAKGGSIKKAELSTKIATGIVNGNDELGIPKVEDGKKRASIITLLNSLNFLKSTDKGWAFDGTTLTLAS